MTRSIGDFVATEVGVCPEPEMMEAPIKKLQDAEEGYLIAGSDGIWDRYSDQEVMDFVVKYNGDCQKATNDLVTDA
jgi:serine/threonine protein phosphatase PrpC